MPRASVKRPRLGLEPLEGRDCPAFITWVNAGHPNAGNSQFSNPWNWFLANAGLGVRAPQAGDDVELVNANNGGQLYGFSGNYHSIRLHAPLTVTLGGAVTTWRLSQNNGAFQQDDPGDDITVTGSTISDARFTHSLVWTGGVMNSTSNHAKLTVTGQQATALIDPPNGQTLSTNNSIIFDNKAQGVIDAGGQAGALEFGLAANELKIMAEAKVVAETGVEVVPAGPNTAIESLSKN